MGSLRNKIITGTTALSLGNIISRFAAFFTVILVTRGVSLFDYGVVTLILSVTGPVNTLTGLGMDDLIVADTSRSLGEGRRDRAKKILVSFFGARFIILLILLFCGMLFRELLIRRYGEALRHYFTLLGLLVLVQFARNATNIVLAIHQRFSVSALANMLEPIFKLGVVCVLFFNHWLNVQTILLSYVLAAFLTVLVIVPILVHTLDYFLHVKASEEPILLTTFRAHGKWQLFLDIVSNIGSSIKYWMIKFFLSTEAVAIFSVAQSMFSAIVSFLPIKDVVFPIISEKSNEPEFQKMLVQKITKYAMLIYLAALFAVIFIAPPLIRFFFPKYIASIFILELMSLRLPLNAFSLAQAPMFISLQEQKYLSLISIKNIISVLIFAPPLMIFLGLPGAVIEGFIPVILSIVWREELLRKKYNFSSFSFKTLFTYDTFDRKLFRSLAARLFFWRAQDKRM